MEKIIYRPDPRLDGPTLDMTAEGQFLAPPAAPWASRILRCAMVVAVLAAGLSAAAFALWFALMRG